MFLCFFSFRDLNTFVNLPSGHITLLNVFPQSFKRRSSPISSNAKRKKPNKQPTPQFYDPISRGMKQNEAIAATSFSPPMLPPPPLSPPPLLKKRLRPPTLRTRPSVQPSSKQILVPQIKGWVCENFNFFWNLKNGCGRLLWKVLL